MDFSFHIVKNTDPYPFNEDQEAWLKELETTDRKQGRGWLESNNTFCCLGIACHLFNAIRLEPDNVNAYRFKMSEQGKDEVSWLPMPLAYRLKLRGATGAFVHSFRLNGVEYDCLASMNDAIDIAAAGHPPVFTFKDIAAYMRHDPWNMFLADDEVKKRYEGLPLS